MLDRQHPLPVYYQLKEILREKIAQGIWIPGEQIPSERELSEEYQISRATVRQALNGLIEDGCVERRQGLGTYVIEPKIVQYLTRLTGYTEDMRQRGLRPNSQVLRLELADAPRSIAKQLEIEPETPVVLLERLRLAEGIPMAIETCYLNFEGVEHLLKLDFAGSVSLYKVLGQRFDVIPMRTEQRMEAAPCSPREQELLQIGAGSPVLKNVRVTYDQHNRVFEYALSAYRGDRYVFYVELTV
ncbi:MAG: GntR family transcriptional regulator [Anaerolineae bacterium]|nr:GntR family transcriptional regulator [Anaerolineae bacterium]